MFGRRTLGMKLILTFVLSIFIPLTLLGVALSAYFNNSFTRESELLFTNTFYAVSGNITASIDDLDNFSAMPYFYAEVMNDLKNFNSSRFYTDPVLQFDTIHDYTTTLKQLISVGRDNITDVVFFPVSGENGAAFLLNRTGGLETINAPLEEQPWYEAAVAANGSVYLVANETDNYYQRPPESLFSVIRIVKDVNTRQNIGALKVDASNVNISETFQNITVSEHSFFLLLDGSSNVIYATKPPPDGLIAQIPADGARFKVNGDTFLTYSGLVDRTDWRLVYLSSGNDIVAKTRPILYFTAAMGVLFLLLSVFIFAARTAKPLLEQQEKEHRLEIGQKTAEYMALQAQINPHFLNNTLSSFIALNRLGRKQALEDSIIDLTRLFRYTCSGGEVSPVEAELKFSEQYLNLQKLRFPDRISFSVSCEEAAKQLEIPKLLLQPLVENSIIHGMEPYDDKIEIELIAAVRETPGSGKCLSILVRDSGHGFDRTALDFSQTVGLKNVKERVELFDQNASFQISSEVGAGTCCTLEIPMTSKKEGR